MAPESSCSPAPTPSFLLHRLPLFQIKFSPTRKNARTRTGREHLAGSATDRPPRSTPSPALPVHRAPPPEPVRPPPPLFGRRFNAAARRGTGRRVEVPPPRFDLVAIRPWMFEVVPRGRGEERRGGGGEEAQGGGERRSEPIFRLVQQKRRTELPLRPQQCEYQTNPDTKRDQEGKRGGGHCPLSFSLGVSLRVRALPLQPVRAYFRWAAKPCCCISPRADTKCLSSWHRRETRTQAEPVTRCAQIPVSPPQTLMVRQRLVFNPAVTEPARTHGKCEVGASRLPHLDAGPLFDVQLRLKVEGRQAPVSTDGVTLSQNITIFQQLHRTVY